MDDSVGITVEDSVGVIASDDATGKVEDSVGITVSDDSDETAEESVGVTVSADSVETTEDSGYTIEDSVGEAVSDDCVDTAEDTEVSKDSVPTEDSVEDASNSVVEGAEVASTSIDVLSVFTLLEGVELSESVWYADTDVAVDESESVYPSPEPNNSTEEGEEVAEALSVSSEFEVDRVSRDRVVGDNV